MCMLGTDLISFVNPSSQDSRLGRFRTTWGVVGEKRSGGKMDEIGKWG